MRDSYDIVIIGAGPAGLNAGIHITRSGFSGSVLLVDKTVPWDHPIPCAEGVGKLGFEEAVEVRPSWIRQPIDSACFHAPDGSTITYRDKHGGYIINRARMQQDMAEQLQTAGVHLILKKRVSRVTPMEQRIRRVLFEDGTSTNAKVVVDASGPVCGIGKGEAVSWKPNDLEPAYFVWVENINMAPDLIHIYAGQNLAPGGYAWVFPRGTDAANIGIVLGKRHVRGKNLRSLLDQFISEHFPTVRIVQRFAGSIPCGCKKGPVAIEGLIKTGDAASTINPISRAGISEALLSGGLAGDHAIRMLSAETSRKITRICKEYDQAWSKHRGNRHLKLSRVKNSLLSVPDEDYNQGARLLSSIPTEELTMSKIFRASLGRFPRLVWALRHLM